MGYAYYELHDGREAGYGVEATCDEDGCDAKIDRGLAHLCGDNPATHGPPEYGCGDYFCVAHLYVSGPEPWPRTLGGCCRSCWTAGGGKP